MEKRFLRLAEHINQFAKTTMKADGIGTAEFDLLHLVRRHPGITQAQIREKLKLDKGAAARRTANLENKGFLVREQNPEDKRSSYIHATKKAEKLKNSKSHLEGVFYEWLLNQLSDEERTNFVNTLEKLELISQKESTEGYPHVKEILEENNQ